MRGRDGPVSIQQAPRRWLYRFSKPLYMMRFEILVKSRKKLKRGVDTRANESTRICLGARNGVFQICVPQREDSTAHRLQSFWIARRSFLGSLPAGSLTAEEWTQVMERAWGLRPFAREQKEKRVWPWVHHQDLSFVDSMPTARPSMDQILP